MDRWFRVNRVVFIAAWLVLSACDPRITSLGAWRPDAGRPDDTQQDAAQLDAAPPDSSARDADPDAAPSETAQYLEAESGELSGGFRGASDSNASAGQFLSPPDGVSSENEPGASRARYTFEITRAATYLLWGRIRGPGAEHNRFWFQLDGGDWHKWRISTGDIWFWDAVHEDMAYDRPLQFALAAGQHTLVIANCVDGVGLDRLYVALPGDAPPGNATPCNPPHSIERNGQCQPSCGSHGMTGCGGPACQGRPQFSTYDCPVCCIAAP
jgi:hypothetical protein